MEYKVINTDSDEYLQHWGIKGQKWGVRRYQNKDGTLTPAGQKRYNKEMEKLKQETARVKAEEKIAANKKKTQTKIDKLEAKKQALEERKKALKEGNLKEDKPEETVEQKRERLLKSTDPKEIFEGRDVLSTFELNDRINRIDTEARLQSKIVEGQKKTGLDYVNNASKGLESATNLYKKVDNAYSTVTNSAIGKTLAKKLGLEPPKKKFDLMEFWEKRHEMSDEQVEKGLKRARNYRQLEAEVERMKKEEAEKAANNKSEKAAKKLAEAQKQVDEYNERLQREYEEAHPSNSTYRYRNNEYFDRKAREEAQRNTTLLLEGPVANEVHNSTALSTQRGVGKDVVRSMFRDADYVVMPNGDTIIIPKT